MEEGKEGVYFWSNDIKIVIDLGPETRSLKSGAGGTPNAGKK